MGGRYFVLRGEGLVDVCKMRYLTWKSEICRSSGAQGSFLIR
jgi:hypothetical protein